MIGSIHQNCQRHITVLYALISLLFLISFANTFFFIYFPKNCDCQMISPEKEEGYVEHGNFGERRTADFRGKVAARKLQKREISNAIPKESEWSSEESTIDLDSKITIKKSDLWNYCLAADDYCRRNNYKLQENTDKADDSENVDDDNYSEYVDDDDSSEYVDDVDSSEYVDDDDSSEYVDDDDSSEKIIDESNKDCVLTGIGKEERLKLLENYNSFSTDPFQSLKTLSFWNWNSGRRLVEYRYNKNADNYNIVNNVSLNDNDWGFGTTMVYKGSYYWQYRRDAVLIKYNLTTERDDVRKEISYPYPIPKQGFPLKLYADENGLWLFYAHISKDKDENAIEYLKSIVALRIDPETLEIISDKKQIRYATLPFVWWFGSFVAYGRLYKIYMKVWHDFYIKDQHERDMYGARKDQIYSLLDLYERDTREIAINFTAPPTSIEIAYNWRSKYLYIKARDCIFSYKLSFRCADEK